MGIPDHFTWLLRNLYAGREAIEPDKEKQAGSKLGKEYVKAVYCHPGPITSWQIDGETMEIVTDFIFVGSKSSAVVD